MKEDASTLFLQYLQCVNVGPIVQYQIVNLSNAKKKKKFRRVTARIVRALDKRRCIHPFSLILTKSEGKDVKRNRAGACVWVQQNKIRLPTSPMTKQQASSASL